MSTFLVEKKKISKIYPHPTADLLELGQVEGMTFQFCLGKGRLKVGDEVVYFPVDSVFPKQLIDFFNIEKYLCGPNKDRLKTVRLRQQISQGYVDTVDEIKKYLNVEELPENLMEALGVTKYEPPENFIGTANLVRLPDFVSVYDIEGCDRHPDIVGKLMYIPCIITEKCEGTNYSISIDSNKKISVNQRNHSIVNLPDHDEHTFWKISRKYGMLELISLIQDEVYPGKSISLRGELIGPSIQSNHYKLKEMEIRLFDLEVNATAVDSDVFYSLVSKYTNGKKIAPKFAPVLANGVTLFEWLNGKTIQEASSGKSEILPERLREGIVIKPCKEQYVTGFGRLFIKQRDPIYLDKYGY